MPATATIPRSKCARCKLKTHEGGEVFYHKDSAFKFDVDLALQIVNDGREPVQVDPESLRHCLRHTEVDEQHLPHVSIGRPGIIAHVTYHLDDGQTIVAHLLIDGNHRAARSLKDGLPFFAYLLDADETTRTLKRAPKTVSVSKLRRPSASR